MAIQAHSTRFRLGYRPELDGLRGIAVLAVIAGHAHLPIQLAGYIGVDVFFVVSGFLITSLLLQEWDDTGTISIRQFYARRALRIGPAFLVLLLATAVYTLIFAVPEVSLVMWRAILISGSYLSNWATALPDSPQPLGFLTHTWSLAAEEQYYLIWPVLMCAALRWGANRRAMAQGIAAGIVALLLLRVWLILRGAPAHRLYAGLDTHGADSILIGCFVAVWLSQSSFPAAGWPLRICRSAAACGSLLALGVLVFALDIGVYVPYGVSTAMALATAAGVVVLLSPGADTLRRLFGAPSLAGIGRISYGLYLWHWPIQCWLWHALVHVRGWAPTPAALLAIAVTFMVAMVSYHFIERPLLRLRPRFAGRPAPPTLRSTVVAA
jgi:peptidoglycan/LPS O-acetylase OafA/YrhL